MTRLVTLAPSTAIINYSSIDIEVNEDLSESNWKLVESKKVIPYWPRYLKEGILCVRYSQDKTSVNRFSIVEKEQILLKMNSLRTIQLFILK